MQQQIEWARQNAEKADKRLTKHLETSAEARAKAETTQAFAAQAQIKANIAMAHAEEAEEKVNTAKREKLDMEAIIKVLKGEEITTDTSGTEDYRTAASHPPTSDFDPSSDPSSPISSRPPSPQESVSPQGFISNASGAGKRKRSETHLKGYESEIPEELSDYEFLIFSLLVFTSIY